MRKRLAVDMSPLGPGGQNGGAGLLATTLVRQLSQIRPEWEFVLLTSAASHGELAALEAGNVRRVSTEGIGDTNGAARPLSAKQVARTALRVLPLQARVRATDFLWRARHSDGHAQLIDELQPDLLFCPLTVPYFWRAGVPLVSIVYDLQHVAFPAFFSDEQRLNRARQLDDVINRSDRVVCISNFVRQTVLDHTGAAPDKVVTIHIGLLQEFADQPAQDQASERYLLYPANFWPHKNHLRLFEALALHRQRTGSDVKLVCTGAANAAMEQLRQQAARQGPDVVSFTGYVSPREFQALLDQCWGLIYPSLYEGFGVPVLEAMARGKPLLCSNAGSLPEVAGDAALYFNPIDPEDIAGAIASIEEDREGIRRRVEAGRERAREFGTAEAMARKYAALIEDVLGTA